MNDATRERDLRATPGSGRRRAMASGSKRGRAAPAAPPSDTTNKYMDAAEALFIQLGYEGTSVRAISAKAKLSLGTIVYHWGTKEKLFRDVCLRRFGSIVEEQLRRLRSCAGGAARGSLDLEQVL